MAIEVYTLENNPSRAPIKWDTCNILNAFYLLGELNYPCKGVAVVMVRSYNQLISVLRTIGQLQSTKC